MIEAHHKEASAKGVKVVHCCGYDSTPFDLGVLLLADHARKNMGRWAMAVHSAASSQRS
jgi:short subunit dehydrogenase-like uncharacterized protein